MTYIEGYSFPYLQNILVRIVDPCPKDLTGVGGTHGRESDRVL